MVGFWASCYIWVRYSDRKDIRVYQLCGPSVEAFGSADSLLCERHYRLFTNSKKGKVSWWSDSCHHWSCRPLHSHPSWRRFGREIIDTRSNPEIPTYGVVHLAEVVPVNINFEFNGKHFLQKHGTAIGTRVAPSYANLFMHDLESELLDLAPVRPYMWLRYIDDIFVVWTEGNSSFRSFLSRLIGITTLKFTWR